MNTMIAAGKRIDGIEQRVYQRGELTVEAVRRTERETPVYLATSTRPFTVMMQYAGVREVDVQHVYYDGSEFLCLFILWCDSVVTICDTFTGEELGKWYGAGMRQQAQREKGQVA